MITRIFTCILFSLMLTATEKAIGQDLLDVLPTTKEGFVATEKKVLATIDWLENTPLDKEEDKRMTQKTLLLGWVSNSPTVSIEINSDILTFIKKNPDLLLTFMGGWTRYALQNNYSKNTVSGSLAGIKSAIKVYKNFKLKKDKEMEKLIEIDDKGGLESWVKSKLKK